MDTYVYYRARVASGAQLQTRVRAMQAALARLHRVPSELKRRPESTDGFQTWMEIYLDVPDHFDAALERAVVTADLLPLIDGVRHVEHFLDGSSCA